MCPDPYISRSGRIKDEQNNYKIVDHFFQNYIITIENNLEDMS